MSNTKFKAGMYLLETLTSGMYNDPLVIYREYVQNSVDAIDQLTGTLKDSKVNVDLDPFQRSVTIRDNGPGVSQNIAEQILSSIGNSDKLGSRLRGFRGIGRLGGIAFAKKVVFKTAAKGEEIVSTQEWNCEKLRSLLSSNAPSPLSIEELFSEVSTFSQDTRKGGKLDSFFEVKLIDVVSFRNCIFDIPKVKKYLTEVSPLPFSQEDFLHFDEVKYYLKDKVPYYGEYKIFVNGEQLFRPYKDELIIGGKSNIDRVKFVELFELSFNDEPLAYGWYGVRRDLLGAIAKGQGVSGIRINIGNIQIGDNHLLDRCFKEERFNSYFIGEIHVVNRSLIPNGRRDDFIDNDAKGNFYNAVEREIGLPLSKEIRKKSRLKEKRIQTEPSTVEIIKEKEKDSKRGKTIGTVSENSGQNVSDTEILEKIIENCKECEKLKVVLKNI